ncbi:MAG TPA: 30S ribosomal protein S6 [Actinomycetota bacterium]|nr:30S ribosomal protein S6 [Actinomycetota bacterium]
MREYEVMFILDPEADESVVSGVADRITGVVSAAGGSISNIDRWGKRRLAYPLDKRTEGYYVVVDFTAGPDSVAELERVLRLADEVVRFKVVRRAAA